MFAILKGDSFEGFGLKLGEKIAYFGLKTDEGFFFQRTAKATENVQKFRK